MLLIALAISTAQATVPPDCPDLASLSAEIRTAIDDVELDRAREHADQVIPALACQPAPVSALALHTALVAAGAAHHFDGQDARAADLFAWAAAAAPTSLPDPALGEGVRDLYLRTRAAGMTDAPAHLVVGKGPLWVDGTPREAHTAIATEPGRHLVQWIDGDRGTVNLMVEALPGEQHTLAGGRLPPALPDAPLARRSVSVGRWMQVGGTLGLLAGTGFLIGSAQAHRAFDTASAPGQLVSLQQTVNSRTIIGGSLALAGTTLVLSSHAPAIRNRSNP